MPAITSLDLSNAKLDVDHIAAIATSTQQTATDRLGHTKLTVIGAVATLKAFNPRGVRVNGTTYNLKDLYTEAGITYVTVVSSFNSVSVASDLSAGNVTIHQGATNESVDAHFSLFELSLYSEIRNYTGLLNRLDIATPLIAGTFLRVTGDSTTPDDNAINIRTTSGVLFRRQYIGTVDVRWWGAKFDNVNEDAPAIQACINYAQPLQKQIICPDGTAKISTQLNVPFSLFGLNLAGQGQIKTRFNYTSISPATDSCIYITGHSGQKCGAVIEGIGFDGLTASTTAITIAGQNGQFIRRCQFTANYNGVVFRNSVAGQFSEYNVVEDCDFTASCRTAMWYNVVGAGDVSFHGSGMRHCTVNTPASAGYSCVQIDPTALPYNSPMDVQVWGNAAGTFIQMAGYGVGRPYFTGTITTEAFTPGLVLCNAPVGRELPLVGNIAGNSADFSRGTLFIVDAVVDNISGSRQTIGGKFSTVQQLTTGSNSVVGIPACMKQGLVIYSIDIVGLNYNYRYLVSTFSKENSGLAPIMATYASFNSTGWGAPTFSVDSVTHALVITNVSWPASGVFANVDVVQSGQSIYDPFFV